ncbi:GEVED domain-containing protein [Zunongwangia endophytica]|uniref:GEVED domain-containing protein n=1 Tax=Zunongwangia endophytica TaxID=1808945 RepID=A0ABV8H447_9FLAO|nr:GEVED domain-containing protein [Zunongwangia endophytica]MDN3595668.1 GEVED domain-containing protein [Zunongwangia endophytica]
MNKNFYLLLLFCFYFQINSFAQKDIAKPVFRDSAQAIFSSSISESRLVPPKDEHKLYNPRNRGINKVIPGKGYPKGIDPALQSKKGAVPSRLPSLSFDGVTTRSTPSDPTGVAGLNHYLNAWNSAFSIYDKEGNILMQPASLASIGGEFEGETLGDPIVVYDQFADRFLISQFSDTPDSFLIAVSKGPDPVNDGWYTYRFSTNDVLPDYPKISVWSDGYYITTNKSSNTADESQVIYVMERDKMLVGETAQFVSFPLPGIETNGFYSPAGFNAMGDNMPPRGNAPIIYLQDDAWAGVPEDHLKIWLVNVDWEDLSNSTIEESQELGSASGVSPFTATFDGGSFSNLAQPGNGPDIDALQATMMYMTQYRRFVDHNSVVMNFVVDVDPTQAEHAGIRWYELRQYNDSGEWSVYQEGTYAPDKSDRFSGSIGIDDQGNIGLGFTILDDSPATPIFPSIRYTGRYSGDQLGIMTLEEQSIVEGNSPNPSTRYGDYAHLTVDPLDGLTFWHNAEYFEGNNRINRIAKFKLAPDVTADVGITEISAPIDASLGENERITVTLRNFGANSQSDIPVSYTLNGQTVTEIFSDRIEGSSSKEFTFSETADFSETGRRYEVFARTSLEGDQNSENDTITRFIRNLPPKDVGVTDINAPVTRENLGNSERITVTIENFGGEEQSNIPIWFQKGNNNRIEEIYPGSIPVGEKAVFSFQQTTDLSGNGRYRISSGTALEDDFDPTNDTEQISVASLNCIPEGSNCSFGDGISYFQLGDILNERIPCSDGYNDYIGFSTNLDRAQNNYTLTVQTFFDADEEEEKFSMWIDLDDNGSFESDERIFTDIPLLNPSTSYSYDFSLPEDAPLGQHLLRIRAGDTSYDGDLNSPCSVMEYGTTHDYSVNIIDSDLDIEDFILNEAELLVLDENNDQYRVVLETSYNEPLRITVHNVLGQKMLENKVENSQDGYVYDLDMSYAARGVYLVRIGTRKVGKVKRFIVK